MFRGELIPDEVVIPKVMEALRQPRYRSGMIIVGEFDVLLKLICRMVFLVQSSRQRHWKKYAFYYRMSVAFLHLVLSD